MLLYDYLIHSARRYPDKVALHCGDQEYTYADLERLSSAFCGFLLRKGLQKGDRVAIYLDNCMEAVVAMFGTWMAGGCTVTIGSVTPPGRAAFVCTHSGASDLISTRQKFRELLPVLGENILQCVYVGDDSAATSQIRFEDIIGSAGADVLSEKGRVQSAESSADDLAAIIYTSGTTGEPKGVTHTHRSIDAAIESIIKFLGNTQDDVILCVLQLNFSYGLVQMLATFRTGATLILEKGYGYPYEIIRLIRTHRVNGFAGTPTIWALLLNLPSRTANGQSKGAPLPGPFDGLESLRYVTNAAAGLPVPLVPRLQAAMPWVKIYLMHGQTECIRTTYLPPEEVLRRPGSVGKGMQGIRLWIEDDDGKKLGPGEIGELVACGPMVMQGYWNDPEASALVLRRGQEPSERVLRTNDLFRMDEEGYFYFVSRKDEIIKSRGEKVSPFEVEEVLYRLDEVAECRVVGIPDGILGWAIRAEIVTKPGQHLDSRRVRAHCAKFLEPYKIPRELVSVASIPKTPGGKIRRKPSEDTTAP